MFSWGDVRLFFLRLHTRLTPSPRCYRICYRGKTEPTLEEVRPRSEFWTFTEACRMMRAIQKTEQLEVLLEDGQVAFTLPPRAS